MSINRDNVDKLGEISFKNLLINGEIKISQRGDYTSATAFTSGDYYLDRWKNLSGFLPCTVQQVSTSQPAGTFGKSLKLAATATGASILLSEQSVEEYILYAEQEVLFSAWVKSDNANARLVIDDGFTKTSGPTHTGGGAWEELTVTKIVNAFPSMLKAHIGISTNELETVSITSGEYIEFTQAHLRASPVASDYPAISYGEELDLCRRYCEVFEDKLIISLFGQGFAESTTNAAIHIPIYPKRTANYTVTVTNPTNFKVSDGATATAVVSFFVTATRLSNKMMRLVAVVASGLTQFRPYRLEGDGTVDNSSILIEDEL